MRTRRRPSVLAVTVLVLLVAMVAGAGVVVWQVWGTGIHSRREARALVQQARSQWGQGKEHTEVVAVLSSPKLGEWPVLAGVQRTQLERGIGWYPRTTAPGTPGNMALAGLRITHGSPFRKLLDLRPGDEITVRDVTGVFVYRVKAAPATVDAGPEGAWVLNPVPGADHAPATAVLTLTTAADLVATSERLVVFAELVREQRR